MADDNTGEDLTALPPCAPDAQAQARIGRATQRYHRDQLRPRFEAAEAAMHASSHGPTAATPSGVLRYELAQARAVLEAAAVNDTVRSDLAQQLDAVARAALKGSVFLGGAGAIAGHDSRGRPYWDIACFARTDTGKPDPHAYARIGARIEVVQTAIDTAKQAFTQARDHYLGDAKTRVLLGNALQHLDHLSTLMCHSAEQVVQNYRADTRSR